jgi:DNA mismatch endonuclease (patch repair protein)
VADTFNKSDRSRIMAAVRGRGNKATELVLARLLREHGLKGWRRHVKIAGRPDFVFTTRRVAIFVDGCFWHGCAKHCRMPASNQKYWDAKIARNVRRDKLTRRTLRARGWKVIRVWEHELKISPAAVARKIERVLET